MRIDVGDCALRAEIDGQGPPHFVCLHGLVDTLAIWDEVARPLSERGRAVRVDQRAHGGADAPPGPYRREDLALDVIGLLDRLEIERAVLFGHSMGGIVAMAAALARPERVSALVLIGTASQCSERVAAWYEKIALAGERDGLSGLAKRIYGPDSTRVIEGDAQGIAHVTRTLESLHDAPLTPRLAGLFVPTLLLVGENDPMGPKASSIIADALPDATLEVIPDCGHWVHVERADRVISAYDRLASDRKLERAAPHEETA
jgi:3-oxoadipate enol-lactonase